MIRPSENSPRARAALLPCHSPSPPPLVVSLVVNFAPANCRAFRPAICGLREGGRREEEPRGSARPQKSGYNGQERRARSPLPPSPPPQLQLPQITPMVIPSRGRAARRCARCARRHGIGRIGKRRKRAKRGRAQVILFGGEGGGGTKQGEDTRGKKSRNGEKMSAGPGGRGEGERVRRGGNAARRKTRTARLLIMPAIIT